MHACHVSAFAHTRDMRLLLTSQVDIYGSEAALLGALSAAVAAADPDILLGYEVQRASLGYAAERAAVLGLASLLRALSRLPRVSTSTGGRLEVPLLDGASRSLSLQRQMLTAS